MRESPSLGLGLGLGACAVTRDEPHKTPIPCARLFFHSFFILEAHLRRNLQTTTTTSHSSSSFLRLYSRCEVFLGVAPLAKQLLLLTEEKKMKVVSSMARTCCAGGQAAAL